MLEGINHNLPLSNKIIYSEISAKEAAYLDITVLPHCGSQEQKPEQQCLANFYTWVSLLCSTILPSLIDRLQSPCLVQFGVSSSGRTQELKLFRGGGACDSG